MTDYQWQVVLALIRLVLKIEARTNDDNDEWIDINVSKDRSILEEVLKGEPD